jgi:hypothetical protein
MRHHAFASAVENEWTSVSRARPCTICGGQSRCRRGADDEFAACARVASEWPLSTGGWVHRVGHFPRAVEDAGVEMSPAQ